MAVVEEKKEYVYLVKSVISTTVLTEKGDKFNAAPNRFRHG